MTCATSRPRDRHAVLLRLQRGVDPLRYLGACARIEHLASTSSVKPIDTAALVDAVRATRGRIVVAEDHWPEGGIGDAVLAALVNAGVIGEIVGFIHLAPRQVPGSGKPAELRHAAGIDATHITAAVNDLVG